MKSVRLGDLRVHPNVLGLTRGPRCDLAVCRGACCTNGIWVDTGHVERIRAHSADVAALLPAERRDVETWFETELLACVDFPSGRGLSTSVVDDPEDPDRDTCVFLLPGSRHCALQVASGALGLGYPGLKPFDCATYPVLRSEGELMLDLWSPEELDGADCQQPGPPARVVDVFREELELAVGPERLALLVRLATADLP